MEIKFELKNANEDDYYGYIKALKCGIRALTTYDVYKYWDIDNLFFDSDAAIKKLKEYNEEPDKQAALFLGLILHDLYRSNTRWMLEGTKILRYKLFDENEPKVIYLITATWKAADQTQKSWNILTDAAKLMIEVL